MPSTIKLHRVIPTSPEKIYRAFLEADALAKWLPPNGFTCTVHRFEPTVGGKFRMSFRNFTTGNSHSFGGEYHELVPGQRLRYTDTFDDPNLPGEMEVVVSLTKGKRRFDPTFRISLRLLMLWPNEAPTYDDYRVYA